MLFDVNGRCKRVLSGMQTCCVRSASRSQMRTKREFNNTWWDVCATRYTEREVHQRRGKRRCRRLCASLWIARILLHPVFFSHPENLLWSVADKWISSGSRTVVCETYEALRTMVKDRGDCFHCLGRIIKRIVKEI